MSAGSIAVAFALSSLLFAGILDVLFKRYARRERSRGMYVSGIGLVWGGIQLLVLTVQGQPLILDPQTLSFGLAAGLMVLLSNLLLIESLTHLDVSIGSTIYRLNTVGVVILSFLFLAEGLGTFKLLGIGFSVAAALLLFQHPRTDTDARMLSIYFWVAVLASVLRAGFGVTSKAGLLHGANASSMMAIAAACWVLGGFLYALLRERRVRVTRDKLVYAGLSGVVVFLVVNTLLLALQYGEASVVAPIANLSFVVALALSVATRMERLTPRKCGAVACASISIALLARVL